jgi:hypothetical protein
LFLPYRAIFPQNIMPILGFLESSDFVEQTGKIEIIYLVPLKLDIKES